MNSFSAVPSTPVIIITSRRRVSPSNNCEPIESASAPQREHDIESMPKPIHGREDREVFKPPREKLKSTRRNLPKPDMRRYQDRRGRIMAPAIHATLPTTTR